MIFEYATRRDKNGNRYYLGIDNETFIFSRERGSCQGEWINILYPADVYSDSDIKEYECYFFGMYYEYNARYNGDNITFYYSDNYTRDEIIKDIAAEFNAAPDQIIFNSCY